MLPIPVLPPLPIGSKPLQTNAMNILIASDSFKDALPAFEVCRAIKYGIRAANPGTSIEICPLADGGEGTYEVLGSALALRSIEMPVLDPLRRPILATYGLSMDGKLAFIEMAKTAGLQLLLPSERNPALTSSFGVGQQIAHAVERGAQKIVLAIGGSATNDLGIGMASALGWQFLDDEGVLLPAIGSSLRSIQAIIPPENRPDIRVDVICDVNNPLLGPSGAARVYARQKGADDAMIDQLEEGGKHFAWLAAKSVDAPDPDCPGAGAAGGMGFGVMYFLKAALRPGADVVLDLLDIDKKIEWADMVVTGEGKIDHQTTHGKLVQRLCRRAAKLNTPVIAFCGRLEATNKDIGEIGLKAAYTINDSTERVSLADMLQNTRINLQKTARAIFSGEYVY